MTVSLEELKKRLGFTPEELAKIEERTQQLIEEELAFRTFASSKGAQNRKLKNLNPTGDSGRRPPASPPDHRPHNPSFPQRKRDPAAS